MNFTFWGSQPSFELVTFCFDENKLFLIEFYDIFRTVGQILGFLKFLTFSLKILQLFPPFSFFHAKWRIFTSANQVSFSPVNLFTKLLSFKTYKFLFLIWTYMWVFQGTGFLREFHQHMIEKVNIFASEPVFVHFLKFWIFHFYLVVLLKQ